MGMSTKKTEDFGKWYSELVVAAELISYYDVSGRPEAPWLHSSTSAPPACSVIASCCPQHAASQVNPIDS